MKDHYHIVFDGRMIGSRMTGVARHLINLLNGLNQVAPKNKYTVILNSKDAFEYFGDKVDIVWAKSEFLSISEYREVPRIINMLKPDIFHNPSFSPIIPRSSVPYFITIHDLIRLKQEKNYMRKFFYKHAIKRACRRSDRVLTVSEYSKQEISTSLNVRKDHIDVIYNGIQDRYFMPIDPVRVKEVSTKYMLPEKYILYVGSHDVHRNLAGTIEAYLKSGVNIPLVLALEWDHIKRYCESELKPSNVICLGTVPDIDLLYLYKGASLFLFMSFIEGFGLPMIEAFASGVPVITSNVSSLPEVSAGCAIEVDPWDTNAIAGAIKMILNDDVLRNRNVQMGLERAKEFTVRKMAERVLNVYSEVLKERGLL
ncbi:MAG TPA: glycosyltransferase family 1 protein [bacterium]|nr:glycosyltransferase family 1 protein [bacterium]